MFYKYAKVLVRTLVPAACGSDRQILAKRNSEVKGAQGSQRELPTTNTRLVHGEKGASKQKMGQEMLL